jgi:hypothetical protein
MISVSLVAPRARLTLLGIVETVWTNISKTTIKNRKNYLKLWKWRPSMDGTQEYNDLVTLNEYLKRNPPYHQVLAAIRDHIERYDLDYKEFLEKLWALDPDPFKA